MKTSCLLSVSPFVFIVILNMFFLGCKEQEDPKQLPVVKTTSIGNVSTTSVSLGGIITNDGGDAISEQGVCWNKIPSADVNNQKTMDASGENTFEVTVEMLEPETQYYLKAFATNSVGIAYGNEIGIKTLPETAMEDNDAIYILSVSPTSGFIDGETTDFEVTVRYQLSSISSGTLMVGFNNKDDINSFILVSEAHKIISQGSGQHTFSVSAEVKDWGKEGTFDVYVNLSEDPIPARWTPLARDRYIIYPVK